MNTINRGSSSLSSDRSQKKGLSPTSVDSQRIAIEKEIYAGLTDLFLKGTWTYVTPQSNDRTISSSDLQPETKFEEDLGIDSLSVVELVMTAERRFNIEISSRDLDSCKKLGDLCNLIIQAKFANK